MSSRLKKFLASEKATLLRFLAGLCGLTLAFAAAVFSTIERVSGNLFLSLILASVSLMIAAAVAITVVPYLARRVTLRRVRDAFDYDVTREGIVYLAFTLIIGIAALNTGNNLLFIIVSAMLAAIIVSGAASAAVLRALEVEVMLPRHVFAQTDCLARLKVRNQRNLIPALSVALACPRAKKGTSQNGSRSPQAILRKPIYFAYIATGRTSVADVQLRFERRGKYAQEQFGLVTRFPFSLFRKTRRLDLPQELIVYPAVQPTDEMLDLLPTIRGEFESFVRGRGYDLYRIRDHVPEDSARNVDWKATAKTGELKVREFTREDERKLRIVFDNPVAGVLDDAAYERAVSLAGSLAWYLNDEQAELSFVAPGCDSGCDLNAFLRHLALAEPAKAAMEFAEISGDAEWFNLVVTARTRGGIPTALWAKSYFVFVGN